MDKSSKNVYYYLEKEKTEHSQALQNDEQIEFGWMVFNRQKRTNSKTSNIFWARTHFFPIALQFFFDVYFCCCYCSEYLSDANTVHSIVNIGIAFTNYL